MPEKILAKISGHKSTKALCCYERTSSEQQNTVSKVINNPGEVFQRNALEVAKATKLLQSPVHLLENISAIRDRIFWS